MRFTTSVLATAGLVLLSAGSASADLLALLRRRPDDGLPSDTSLTYIAEGEITLDDTTIKIPLERTTNYDFVGTPKYYTVVDNGGTDECTTTEVAAGFVKLATRTDVSDPAFDCSTLTGSDSLGFESGLLCERSVLNVELDKTKLNSASADVWTGTSDSAGTVKLCIKDSTVTAGGTEVSSYEVLVSVGVTLTDQGFTLDVGSLTATDADTATESFDTTNVEAELIICSETGWTQPATLPPVNQGEMIYLCVQPNAATQNNGLEIAPVNIKPVVLTQVSQAGTGDLKDLYYSDTGTNGNGALSRYTQLTDTSSGKPVKIAMLLVGDFFGANIANVVEVAGTADLVFASSRRLSVPLRLSLKGSDSAKPRTLQEEAQSPAASAPISLDISLSSDNKIKYDENDEHPAENIFQANGDKGHGHEGAFQQGDLLPETASYSASYAEKKKPRHLVLKTAVLFVSAIFGATVL